jgi:dTDP-4-dehydrorhamnose reductase
MRILLIGASGQLGHELHRALQSLGEILAPARSRLDLRDVPALHATIGALRPDIVVNAAAFTGVDLAESNPDEAMAVNATAVGAIAKACRERDALMVHYSTDYVFDGLGGAPYDESATPSPVNVYGHTKLAGDRLLLASGCRHLLLRISWLYSLRRRNFMQAVIAQARAGKVLRVVSDQRSAPTPAWLVADISAHLVDRILRGEPRAPTGLLNLSCSGECTWHDFAQAIFAHLALHPDLMRSLGLDAIPRIESISSGQYQSPARRPYDTRLALGRLLATGLHPTNWRAALEFTLDGLLPPAGSPGQAPAPGRR